jgi:hypothetical protein
MLSFTPPPSANGELWMQSMTGRAPYAIREAALIFETASAGHLDFIIGVHAPLSLRIHRTIQRDHITREKVLQRMRCQIEEEIKMRLCDATIQNDGQQAVLPQVLALHEQLLELAAKSYLSFANASLILPHAFSIFGRLFAKENRTQAGSPNASPITEETCAAFKRYMLKSAELRIISPSDFYQNKQIHPGKHRKPPAVQNISNPVSTSPAPTSASGVR